MDRPPVYFREKHFGVERELCFVLLCFVWLCFAFHSRPSLSRGGTPHARRSYEASREGKVRNTMVPLLPLSEPQTISSSSTEFGRFPILRQLPLDISHEVLRFALRWRRNDRDRGCP